MSVTAIISQRLVIMFILIFVGAALYKFNKLTDAGAKSLVNVLVYLIVPCMIFQSFQLERTPATTLRLFLSAIGALVILLLSMLVGQLFYKKDGVASFGVAFSNAGFFGLPLVSACLGEDGVFCIVCFVAILNILQWTYGISILTGEKSALSLKSIATAPFMVSIVLGLIFYFAEIPLPELCDTTLDMIVATNAPIAMLVVGTYLAQCNLFKMLTRLRFYGIAIVRQLLVPIITVLVLMLPCFNDYTLRMTLLIVSSCPVGANVAMYAQLHNKDYPYAVQVVVVSTLTSILTMPLFVWVGSYLWG